jgi:hypothetical protein
MGFAARAPYAARGEQQPAMPFTSKAVLSCRGHAGQSTRAPDGVN